jgi:PAS domain S-box-containing protein
MSPSFNPLHGRAKWQFYLPAGVVFLLGIGATLGVYTLMSSGASSYALIVGTILILSATTHCLINMRSSFRQQQLAARSAVELAASEARFHAIFDQAAIGIVLADRMGRLLQVNRAMERMFGYEPGEMLGKFAVSFVSSDDFLTLSRLFEELASGVRDGYECELRCRHREKRLLWIRANASVLRDAAEGSFFSIHTIENITVRKQAEEALKRSKEAAETATRAKSEFLSSMSHEIRTPMTAILGFAGMLMDGVADPDLRDAVVTIQRNGNYLMEIVNDILDLSKIEAGRLEIEHIPCSPRQIVGEIVDMIKVRAEAKGIMLQLECVGFIPQTILSDPVRLRQIVLNLVDNAVKFTERGLVRLTMKWSATTGQTPQLQLDVIDTGMGMSPKQLDRLFAPFVQADASLSRRFGGSGLGLVICKRLAELLGGDIKVHSALGQGAAFTVVIKAELPEGVPTASNPLEDVHANSETAEPEEINGKSSGKNSLLGSRILVAEDGADNKRLISLILTKAGAQVTVVENGAEALACILHCKHPEILPENVPYEEFDAILMDMQMPVMDGYEATQQLREAGYTGTIIALTAHAMSSDRQKCLDCGCDLYLSKPIDRDTLIATVAHTLCRC